MQQTLESLLIAILVALNPVESEAPTFAQEAGSEQAGSTGNAVPAPLTMDVDPCRHFNDPGARRNCVIRTKRTPSGSIESGQFPSQTVWMAPNDPGMPFRFRLPSAQ